MTSLIIVNDDDDDDDVLLFRPEDASLVEVHASAARRRQVQPRVHPLGRQTRRRLSHCSRTVQARGATLGSSEEQPNHDLRQTQSITQVLYYCHHHQTFDSISQSVALHQGNAVRSISLAADDS